MASPSDRPPLLLVHGAANSSRVWVFWRQALERRGWTTLALDLRGHGERAGPDLGATRMADYAEDVVLAARTLPRPPVLLGWSMGGLVAIMAGRMCVCGASVGCDPIALNT